MAARLSALGLALLALVGLRLGRVRLLPDGLPTGSVDGPTAAALPWWGLYWIGGAVAVLAAGAALHRLDLAPLAARVAALPARATLAAAVLLAFASARGWQAVLGGAQLFDDESAYLYAARLLAAGQTAGPALDPALWGRGMLILEESRSYTQYFLGWPLLLAPGAALGLEDFVNPLMHAATVPAVALLLRDRSGPVLARLGPLLYASAPMPAATAATLLSHPACTAALAWAWVALEARRRPATDAAFGFCWALAFLVRPISGLALGLPWLLAWLATRPGPARLGAFALATLPLAALFFAFHLGTTGAALRTAYAAMVEQNLHTGGLFASHPPAFWAGGGDVPSLANLAGAGERLFTAAFVLDHELLGWPTALAFAAWTTRRADAWPLLGLGAAVAVTHDLGPDLLGANHLAEAALPGTVLTLGGLGGLARRFSPGAAAGAAAMSLLLAASVFFPLRAESLARAGAAAAAPEALAAELDDAVVFAGRPFVHPACSAPSNGFRLWRPLPRPTLDDAVLWLNHHTLDADRAAMTRFSGRSGWVFAWEGCRPRLFALDDPRAAEVPAGFTGPGFEGPRCPPPWMCVTEP